MSEGGDHQIEFVPPPLERILIVRLSAMGDVIHTLPAAYALRHAFPRAHIGWLIEERWAELLCAADFSKRGERGPERPLVDEIHLVSLRSWGKSLLSFSTLHHLITVWNDVRSVRYDVAVDLQGAIRSAILASWSGAAFVYGSAEPREAPASLWYTREVIPEERHVVRQNLSVADKIIEDHGGKGGTGARSAEIDLPRDCDAEQRVRTRLSAMKVGDFAIINPGAGWGAKRWPAERYGEVARKLAALGLQSIVNYGPGEEELARSVEIASRGMAQSMKCTITELIAVTRQARIFIGGDTGPLHLAAALKVPVVGIYGPTDPARNGPYGTRSIVLRSAESVTSHARFARTEQGMLEIGSDSVVAAAEQLLRFRSLRLPS